MQDWKDMWEDRVHKHNGRMVQEDTRLDGRDYHFVSRWNEDEDIDEFLDEYCDDVTKCDQDGSGNGIALHFSVKNAPPEAESC